jgi:hypothetical protein
MVSTSCGGAHRRGVELDAGALAGEIHRRLDAGQLVQLLLDARGAGGAGHALDGKIVTDVRESGAFMMVRF